MLPRTNKAARQLSSAPQIHRTSTLRSIAGKAHETTERIQFLKNDGLRAKQLLDNVPDDTTSRLAWLSTQLNQQ